MPEYPKTENLPTTLHRLETRLYYDYSRITVDIEKTGGEVTVGELPPTRILGEAVRNDDDPVGVNRTLPGLESLRRCGCLQMTSKRPYSSCRSLLLIRCELCVK